MYRLSGGRLRLPGVSVLLTCVRLSAPVRASHAVPAIKADWPVRDGSGGFGIRRQFRRAATIRRHQKQGVVTETTRACLRMQNVPMPLTMANYRGRVTRMPHEHQYTMELCAALFISDALQCLQQLLIVGPDRVPDL